MVPVDEVAEEHLSLFGILVLVLPAVVDGEHPVEQFLDIVVAYRRRHRVGLSGLMKGDPAWHEVGLVLVYDDAARYPRPELERVRWAVCRYEAVTDDTRLNPFVADGIGVARSAGPADSRSDVDTLRKCVTSWGVAWTPAEVSAVRTFIDRHRDVYENPRFHALRRPIPGCDDNRFDFVLDRFGYKPESHVCDQKKWTEDGQRTVNRALAELSRTFPDLRRPARRDRRRDLQKEFHELYRALCAAEQLFRTGEGPG